MLARIRPEGEPRLTPSPSRIGSLVTDKPLSPQETLLEEEPAQPESPGSSPDVSPLVRALLFALVLVSVFSLAFTPLRGSQDEWWHLKAGKWIVEHGQLPHFDIFTYTAEKMVWHNHEWLSQILFYDVYSWGEERLIGGLRALITFKSLVVCLSFALVAWLVRLRSGSWSIALLLALVCADMSRRTISPRPPIFSYVFFALSLLALYGWKLGRLRMKWLWLLVPLMVLWVNLHGMFLLGIVAVGFFAAGELMENGLGLAKRLGSGQESWSVSGAVRSLVSRPFVLLCALGAALCLAALVNPFGYHVFFLSSKFTHDPLLKQVINEMLPTPFFMQHANPAAPSKLYFIPGFANFWVTAAVLLVLLTANRGRLAFGADYLLTGFFLYQATMHWRLLPLFAIASCGSLGFLLAKRLPRRVWAHYAVAGLTALLAWTFVFAIGEPPPQTFFRRNLQLMHGNTMDLGDYPEPMMKFIIRTGFPDRMFSQANYCGFTMWWLSPEHHKLFTDNRFDLFGGEFYPLEATVVEGLEANESITRKGWSQILDEYGVNFVIMERQANVSTKLRKSKAWRHVYYYKTEQSDLLRDGFDIYLRNDPRFNDVAQRALENFQAEHPDWPSPATLDTLIENSARKLHTPQTGANQNQTSTTLTPRP